MTGTILNVAGIVAGGALGLVRKKPLPLAGQLFFKSALGAFLFFFGLRLAWLSVNGSFSRVALQITVALVALVLGRLAGRALRLQKISNRLGQVAREKIAAATPDDPHRFNRGFTVCALLFCAAPLGLLGAVHDGLSEYYYPLAVKAVMDALAAFSFAGMFGGSALLSCVPVLLFQGTISLFTARFLQPWLSVHELADPVNLTGGLLLLCVALIVFEIKKVPVTDYLPALAFAPLLTWLLTRF